MPNQRTRVEPRLARHLRRLLESPPARHDGELGIVVVDGAGRTVLDRNGSASFLPASTQKMVTAAGALAVLGPDFRYVTRLRSTAPVSDRGVIRGNLVLVGSGDPTLATPTYHERILPDRPATPLRALARQLAHVGVRRITGRVIGDPSIFGHSTVPPGWLDRYVAGGIATRVSGLTVDGGRELYLDDGRLASRVADDPARNAARSLVRLLKQEGIDVEGRATVSRDPPAARRELARVESPPLRDLLRHTVQSSDNHMADAIFATIGVATVQPTWKGSARGTRAVLEPLGLDWSGTTLADGSGLSRDNRLTPRLLASLNVRMGRTSVGAQWQRLMAVAGRAGTLSGRLEDTVAEGRLFGKTGTLGDVRALAAVVVADGVDRYHFAVLGNELDDPADEAAVRTVMDLVAVALTERLLGCRLTPPPPRDEPRSGAGPVPAGCGGR